MSKMTLLRRLVCRTTHSDLVDARDAVVELTTAKIAELIKLKEVFEAAAGVCGDHTYYIEVFDSEHVCRYGALADRDLLAEDTDADEDTAWRDVPFDGPPVDLLETEERVDAATMKVTGTGVLWSASPKHADGFFETPELSWEELRRMLDGQCSLPRTDAADPNVTEYLRERDNRDREYVDGKVTPYLRGLLNRAQPKTRTKLVLSDLMGKDDVYFYAPEGAPRDQRGDYIDAAVNVDPDSTDQYAVYFLTYFPELVTALEVLGDLQNDGLGGWVGELLPTTEPAAAETEADRAWLALYEGTDDAE